MEEVKAYCKERFDFFQTQMNDKSDILHKQGTEIEVLKTEFLHLTKSLNALSNALWGIAGTIMVSLFSFFIWYVQSI